MNPIRTLTSWLGRPAKVRRGLLCERLEDRVTPTVSDKLLVAPVDFASLATTQDLIALTPSNTPLNDLANVVQHFNLASIVNVSSSNIVFVNAASALVRVSLKDGADARAAASTLFSTGLYSFVSPNYIYPSGLSGRDLREAVPNDPQYAAQFPHPIIDSPSAWNTTFGSSSVVIAILDDGIDVSHPDLIDNLWHNSAEVAGDGLDNDMNGFIDDRFGWDFLSNSNRVTPDDPLVDTHGTQVAGVLAARINNGAGVAGVAGLASIMPLKVVGNGPTTSLSLARSVSYAVENGAKIINSSLNIDPFIDDPAFRAAVSHAYDSGLLWVNSAGNLNLQDPARARLDEMLVVGATDRLDRKTSYSNYGWGLDISAPGGSSSDGVITTIPGSAYGQAFGTSISTPLVAGTAALLWSANPAWTRDQVASAILANTDSLDAANAGLLDRLGTGRLDAGKSVSGGTFATKLGRLYDMPGPGQDAPPGFDSFRLRLQGNLDPGTVHEGNFELRWAGPDNLFDTGDDRVIGLDLADAYRLGTNSLDFTISGTLDRGLYRFTAKSGGLCDPFNTAVDGDGDGIAGGNLVRYFGNPLRARGSITIDADDSGGVSPGDPPLPPGGGGGIAPGGGVFGDFNNNGAFDATTYPNQGGPQAVPDNPDTSAVFDFIASGFTRPVNYLKVQIELVHSAPADLVMTLVSPGGQRVTLFANRPVPGTGSAATQLFIFEDEVPENTTVTANLITRLLNPDQPLSSLYGSSANGHWQIEVTDTTPGDSGTVISAHLTIGEEPLFRTGEDGEFIIHEIEDNTVIRVLPPAGWEVAGDEKNPFFHVGTDRDVVAVFNLSVAPLSGIVGRVADAGHGVSGFTVALQDGSVAITDDNGYYTFLGLTPGLFAVSLQPRPGYTSTATSLSVNLTASDCSSLGNDFAVTRETGPVQVALSGVAPALRTTSVNAVSFSLSEPVANLRIEDLRLSRDGIAVNLTGATLIGGGTQFTLIGLADETGIDGDYSLTVLAPAPVGQPERLPAPAVTNWTLDTVAPVATLSPIVGPRGIVDSVIISFSSSVNGLDLTDLILSRDSSVISLTSASLSPGSEQHSFILLNLASANTAPGAYSLELKPGVSDAAGNAMASATLAQWIVPERPVRYTAMAAGEGSMPTVQIRDVDGKLVRTLTPFDSSYTGGVRVATGDVNGDLIDDIITAPGRNAGPRVRVFDGKTGLIINDFFAFEPVFRGGLFVSAGDVTGDGIAEIIVTPDKSGGPRVRVLDGLTANTVADFFGIEDVNFRGGARATVGDVTGDGRLDVIVSAGSGGGPRIAVWDGVSVSKNTPIKPFGDFLAFEANLRNGASVTAADLDGDGMAEVIAGAGDGGGPRLTAFSGADLLQGQLNKIADFFIGNLDSRGGLRLALEDINDDNVAELFVGPGSGVGSRIRVYRSIDLLSATPLPFQEMDPFGGFLGGVFLG